MNEMENNKVILFPKGIPGFEEHKEYYLRREEGTPLAQLESGLDQEVGFVLLRSQLFFEDYLSKIDLSDEDAELLEIRNDDQVDVWSIMTLCLSQMDQSTVNLRAPLIINYRTRKGFQLILGDERYSSRQPLFMDSNQDESAKEGAVG